MKLALILVAGLLGVVSNSGLAAPPMLTGVALPTKLTLLTEVGKLAREAPAAEAAGWRRTLRSGHPARRRAAQLHLWLGEVAIARDREPGRALEEFARAQRLVSPSDPVYGCAAYDRAMTLFFHGIYAEAASEFHRLLQSKPAMRGYNRICSALWYRHAAACAGYHQQHAKLGITEPPSLDPLCGVASLAACMRANSRPYDRKTLLAHCRMTGLGNNMADLQQCARYLGMAAWFVKADNEGLKALPKPMVAYVESDHFVAVTRADSSGVSYLCSDCGAWPGGRRDLTWKQWRAMDCDYYLVVTKPGSSTDAALHAVLKQEPEQRVAVGANSRPRLAAYSRPEPPLPRVWLSHLKGIHPLLQLPPCDITCGGQPTACEPNPNQCSGQDSSSSGASGPSAGEPVDLATGQEEYRPEPDLTVYNPIGPSVVWQRQYGSMRGPYQVPNGLFPYAQSAFGNGWNTAYDLQVIGINSGAYLYEPNGSGYQFTIPATPTASNPHVACPSATPGVPMLCTFNYNSDGSLSFAFTQPDHSQWIFSSNNGYALTQMVDRNGNFINFVYSTPGSPGYLLTAITDSNNVPLLTIHHNSRFNITSVSDRYDRSVVYQVKRYPNMFVPPGNTHQYSDELVQVSQIVRFGVASPPSRFSYGYALNTNGNGFEMVPSLGTITVPSPTGRGLATTTINYNGVFVGNIVDANGNTKTYVPVDANDVQVVVADHKRNTAYSYTVNYDNQMRLISRTDGTNKTLVFQAGYLSDNPYRPATVTNGNNETTTTTYDQFGQVQSVTTPRNVTTTYTRDYSVFPLGELTQIQEGSKSPISISYFEPSGLPKTISTPLPGTSGSTQTATTSFTFDALGNPLTLTRPGNDTTATITTTLNYTTDGAYHQPDAIGQPLTVTDNLGHVTHFRYDLRGNPILAVDALGNQTSMQFNLANQQTEMYAPPIGDITNLLSTSRSSLTYSSATKTYNGTLTLKNTSSRSLQGYLLVALTNLTPGVTLAHASGTYVNSPALLSKALSLAPGASTVLNVSFAAPSANVNYGVQTYLTDSRGNPVALPAETRSVYLYTGGPLTFVNTYDETGALFRQVSYRYGKEGELNARFGSTQPVAYTYDAAYRLQTLTDGNSNTTKWTYNTAGWLASVTYPMGDGVQYSSYDSMGHVLKRIDGRGIETNYTYNDPESKLTNVQYVNSAAYPNVSQDNVIVDYDSYGRQQDVYDYSGHQHFDYDDLNIQTEIDTTYNDANGNPLPTVSLMYGFNAGGSRHVMNVETTTTSYSFACEYDAAGRPLSLTNPFGETTQWSYLANNRLASQQYANGVLAEYAYNRRGFLNDLTNYSPTASPLSDFGAMVYDANANRLTKAVSIPGAPSGTSGQTTYAYDIKNQIHQEQSTLLGGYSESFSYDPAGNPLTFKGQANTFNADNQVTDSGFACDGDGNPTSYGGATLAFDPENRMTSFGTTLSAGYRADGMRAWKQSASGRTYFIYDGIRPVLEFGVSGNVTAVNTYGARGLISRNSGVSDTFYTFDPQGSVAQRLDGGGKALATNLYDAFGIGAGTAPASDPFGYGAQWGYVVDTETGLQVLCHRYYNPGAGRFLTRDPVGQRGGVNVYSYVGNGPMRWCDPLGLSQADCAGGGGPSPPAQGPPDDPPVEPEPLPFWPPIGPFDPDLDGFIDSLSGNLTDTGNVGDNNKYLGGVIGAYIGGDLGAAAGGFIGGGVGLIVGSLFGPLTGIAGAEIGYAAGGYIGAVIGGFIGGEYGGWVGDQVGGKTSSPPASPSPSQPPLLLPTPLG